MLENENELDSLDKKILIALSNDSRKPFTELAKEFGVSSGTIHIRMEKLKKSGIVSGSKLIIDHAKLGYTITSFLGVNLHNARDYKKVIEKLRDFENIVEAHYSTGQYNIFCRILVKSIQDLHAFLLELQGIREIQSTQTIMVLDTPIMRDLKIL